jgi:6-phosphofructokinase 1
MGGLAGGAEQIYLNETGITLDKLQRDIEWANWSFDTQGRKLFLAVRNENANANYTTDGLARMLDEEGHGRYDTRTMVIGHLQQGGSPTPADRLLATRFVDAAITKLAAEMEAHSQGITCVGSGPEGIRFTDMVAAMASTDQEHQRPIDQWWLGLGEVLKCVNRES